jgi:hypothetical protein
MVLSTVFYRLIPREYEEGVMRKKLFYILSVLLITLMLPLTVFAEGRIRDFSVTINPDGTTKVFAWNAGIDNGHDSEYRLVVVLITSVQGSCFNPAGNEPANRGFGFVTFVNSAAEADVEGNEEVSINFAAIEADYFADKCPDDLIPVVNSAEPTELTLTLVRIDPDGATDPVDVINYSIGSGSGG